MKRVFASFLIVASLATACTKNQHGADDGISHDRNDDRISSSTSGSSSGSGNISASSVPTVVMNAFKAQFPTATKAEWKKLSNGNYKVQFYIGSVRWEAIYTPTGTRIKLERA